MPQWEWEQIGNNDLTPIRGDGIAIENDSDEYNEESDKNTVEWGEESANVVCPDEDDCRPSLKEGPMSS